MISRKILLINLFLILILNDCAPMPDLVAKKLDERIDDPIEYCRLDEQGLLLLTIRNQGTADSSSTVTRVTFTSPPTGPVVVELDTPAIPANDSVELRPIDLGSFPSNCYFPADCKFVISIDPIDNVAESNERNNLVEGYCLG